MAIIAGWILVCILLFLTYISLSPYFYLIGDGIKKCIKYLQNKK